MSIINTIYFKDQWVDKFEEKETKPDTFYLKNGQKVKCDFMNSSYVTHSFTRGEGYTSSALGLKNSGSMVFVLPDKEVSIDNLLKSPEKAEMILNRPFIFAIKDNIGNILFVGIVNNPNEK